MIILALIGVGRWGGNYLKTIQNIPNAKIKYLCDSSEESLKEFSDTFIKVIHYQELVRYRDINGFIIATPASTHFQIIKYLLSKNKNLLVEKPFVVTSIQAQNVQKMMLSKNLICMAGHTYLYNPAFHTVLTLRSKIGDIRYIEFDFCDNTSMVSDVSALWAWASHPISMALALLEHAPVKVNSWYVQSYKKKQFFPEMIYCELRFLKDIKVFIKIGWLSPVRKRTCTIVGTKGSIIFDDLAERKVILQVNGERLGYPFYDQKFPLENELQEFIRSITTKEKPSSDIMHGVQVMKIIDTIERSLKTSKQQQC